MTKNSTPTTSSVYSSEEAFCKERLELCRVYFEKCEMPKSREVSLEALDVAKRLKHSAYHVEALTSLLRLAAEAGDDAEISKWGSELDQVLEIAPASALPRVWFCKGVVANFHADDKLALRCFLKSLRAYHRLPKGEREDYYYVWSWVNISNTYRALHRGAKASRLLRLILSKYESRGLRGVNGTLYLRLGLEHEQKGELPHAMSWYQKAYAAFLAERNWYNHLYVLYAFARVSRLKRDYAQAYNTLELLDQAISGEGFGGLRSRLQSERKLLEADAIDLWIDSRKGMVKTREGGKVELGKQYVLLNILEALFEAHSRNLPDADRGLSKAELIDRVWGEDYRPEAHDNKLYYNINRLRKLLEPDMKRPRYLLNWKEGYRLAPGLTVHLVGGKSSSGGGNRYEKSN